MATISGNARKLPNWINSFVDYCGSLYAPLAFRKWSAISVIASAMERRVWVHTRGGNLYPNLYVLLVGPPGVGKGLVINEVSKMLQSLNGQNSATDLHIAPTSVTTASLVDEISDAKRKILRPTEIPPFIEFHSLQVVVPEFSDFAPMYDPQFMSALQSFYDCGDVPYGQRRRSKDTNIKITNSQLGLIAGTTPSYLNSFMPEGAWDQGFISRTLMIYSGEAPTPDIFAEPVGRESLSLELRADLKSVFNLFGKMTWSPEAKAALQGWVNAKQPPLPEHRRLMHYSSRRIAQVIKLCIVASAAESNVLSIEKHHFDMALEWLLEAETVMPDIFKSVSAGGDSAAIEDCWFSMFKEYAKSKTPIAEGAIIRFLSDRMPSHSVMRSLEIMLKSGLIEVADSGGPGGSFRYKPRAK